MGTETTSEARRLDEAYDAKYDAKSQSGSKHEISLRESSSTTLRPKTRCCGEATSTEPRKRKSALPTDSWGYADAKVEARSETRVDERHGTRDERMCPAGVMRMDPRSLMGVTTI